MTYPVDPTDPTTPTNSQGATQGAEEFRALKAYIATLVGLGTGINLFRKNLLINGDFGINQRAPASNNDDTYGHDRWNVLTQSNAIAVSSQTDVADGYPVVARLTQSNAAAQRMGYSQIIEAKNCKYLRGQAVTFKINRLNLSVTANLRMAILGWTGTQDSVTSDVVNDWTSSTYTAGNFFLGSNLAVYAVSSAIAMSAGVAAASADLTVTLGSTFNNLIVMVWTESTAAQNVTLDIGNAQLEKGNASSPFDFVLVSQEQELCNWYYRKFISNVAGNNMICIAQIRSGTQAYGLFSGCRMRKVPGVNFSGSISLDDSSASPALTAVSTPTLTGDTVSLLLTAGGGGLTTGRGAVLYANGTTPYVEFDAEL